MIVITLDEDLKLPQVSKRLVDYFKETYDMNFLLSTVYHNFKTNDEHMGYLKGVQEVITKLEILSKAGDED